MLIESRHGLSPGWGFFAIAAKPDQFDHVRGPDLRRFDLDQSGTAHRRNCQHRMVLRAAGMEAWAEPQALVPISERIGFVHSADRM